MLTNRFRSGYKIGVSNWCLLTNERTKIVFLVIFSIIGLYAALLTTLAVIGSRGRTVDVGCTDVLKDRVLTLNESDLEFLLDDTQEIEILDLDDTQEITALGGF